MSLCGHVAYRYKILRVLGKGYFGQVLEVYDHKTKQYATLKIVRNERRFLQQANTEVKILEQLLREDQANTANVVHIKNSFVFRNHACIDFLPDDAILIGQSLNFDLVSLKMFHPYVIDTSVCFNITGDRRRKTKLSVLTKLFLNRSIQTQGKEGHNPIKDAQAAMGLVNLKLEKGLEFGDAVLGGEVPSRNEEGNYEVSNGVRMDKKDTLMTSLSKTLSDHEKTVAVVCDKAVNAQYTNFANFKSTLKTFTVKESSDVALETATDAAVEHNMTICHVVPGKEEENKAKMIKKFTKKMYDFTSINGFFMVLLSGTQSQNAVAGMIVKKPD